MSAPSSTGFWTDRRVVVTGGAGFLGRRIVAELREHGADPVVIRSADYDLTQSGAAEDMIRSRARGGLDDGLDVISTGKSQRER